MKMHFGRYIAVVLFVLMAACESPTPPAENPFDVIAFGSCARENQPQPIWDQVMAQNPDLFLLIGDNIYGDTEDMGVMRAKYDQLGAQAGFQQLRAETPVLGTWDDHDYGVNDGGAEYPMRAESQVEFARFFDLPDDSPVHTREGVYDVHYFGEGDQRVQIILLDTRYFRGPLTRRPEGVEYQYPGRYVPTPDTTVTMLGETQWTWLEAQLQEPAALRIIASSIQVVADEHHWEKWGNMPHERTRLFQLIRETQANGVVFISGDRHLAEMSVLPADDPDGVGYPVYDITGSSFEPAQPR